MKAIWNFLNGKKTAIGGLISFTIGFLQVKGLMDADTAFFILSIAGIFLGIGIAHKVNKLNKDKDAK